MPKKTIAIVPESVKTDNFSKMFIMWLNCMSNGNSIKHEFYGCFWHGCPNCYKPNVINSKNQTYMGTLNDLTVEKRDTIKNASYNHVSTYECQLTKNKEF